MSEIVKATTKKSEIKSENSISRKQNADVTRSINPPFDHILFLQRTIGNHAVQRLIKSGTLQAKLRIGQPRDKFEQEVDRVADAVMRMSEPQAVSNSTLFIQRVCPSCEEDEPRRQPLEEEEELQTKELTGHNAEITPDLESQIQAVRSGGQPLPESVRAYFELRFGCDFSHVRVHTDAKAAQLARMVNAHAFTVGQDVMFGMGQYAPGTFEGQQLLAHELTHVVQQRPQMLVGALPSTLIGEELLQRAVPASPVLLAILGILAAVAACGLPFHLYALSNYGHKTDKWRHCWVSCEMSKTCGPALAQLAGFGKEIRDRAVAVFCDYYPSSTICTGGHGDFMDSINDLVANQACIPWETLFVGPIARLWRRSCKDCCDASGL